MADALRLVRAGGSATRVKRNAEMDFWRSVQAREGELGNSHYEFFYTTAFDLDRSFYAGKRVLDIGCGPRGSLEWAHK
ncbi:MAG: Methyltransferase type 11 [Acidimicrobiales bacterium]|nr:Methyltransferase type 11 [Acidimicrobiales bacterium]